jgi:hypothetical protein
MARRLLALAAAVAMVAGALAVRARLDDKKVSRNTTLRLLCAPELADACEAFAAKADAKVIVTVEDAGKTADRLISAKSWGFEGWLTPGPFAPIVGEARRAVGQPLLGGKVYTPIATTRVGLGMWKDRAAALAAFCKKPVVDWKCLGEAAGRHWRDVGGRPEWGDVKVGLPDPKTTASGLLILGAATTSFFGTSDLSSTDLQDNDAFGAWLLSLANADVDADVGRMLAAGPALVDAVGVIEQAAAPVITGSARGKDATVIYPSPVVTAGVVLGQTKSEAADRLAELLTGDAGRSALAATGWIGAADAPSNLPSPGLLFALRSQWPQ